MSEIQSFLDVAKTQRATDIHIVAGAPVMARIAGLLTPISDGALSPEAAQHLALSLLNDEQIVEFRQRLDYDFVTSDTDHSRYRVNVSLNDGDVGAVIRLLPKEPIKLEELRLPPVVLEVAEAGKGLILITGSTSQGKSTTMASMIDYINRRHCKHIVTIEDPIEYVHVNLHSIIRQRDVGRDTESFSRGLRAALRQDPDVIAIGEMRDYDSIKIALTAAETGVLVISSLHIISIDKLVERLLSYAPDGNDAHVRELLAESLLCVIHQELLPTLDGGKRLACEILVGTDAVRHLLRSGNSFRLRNQIQLGQGKGMQPMKTSVDALLAEHAISPQTHEKVLRNYP